MKIKEEEENIEQADGTKSWWRNEKLHRTNGPAYEGADGSKGWWVNDELHRIDGPAIENADGSKEWWLKDKKLSEELHTKLTGSIKDLPLYIGLGFDEFIHERLVGSDDQFKNDKLLEGKHK